MRILMYSIITGVFLFAISIGGNVQAHPNHGVHTLKELENHITGHVKQLNFLLNQKSSDKTQITEQREEILEHVQEYKELVRSMALETGSRNLEIVLNQDCELLKQTALNHDYSGTLIILERVNGLFMNPLLAR